MNQIISDSELEQLFRKEGVYSLTTNNFTVIQFANPKSCFCIFQDESLPFNHREMHTDNLGNHFLRVPPSDYQNSIARWTKYFSDFEKKQMS